MADKDGNHLRSHRRPGPGGEGDLDVSLEITSGDEFERIGHSFNFMIGSIRHLLARHQELAKENMLATVRFWNHSLTRIFSSIPWNLSGI